MYCEMDTVNMHQGYHGIRTLQTLYDHGPLSLAARNEKRKEIAILHTTVQITVDLQHLNHKEYKAPLRQLTYLNSGQALTLLITHSITVNA